MCFSDEFHALNDLSSTLLVSGVFFSDLLYLFLGYWILVEFLLIS